MRYKWRPQAHPNTEAASGHLSRAPFPPVGQKPFPSPSPASSAAAALQSRSSQAEPPRSIQYRHSTLLDLGEPPHLSNMIRNHRSSSPQFSRSHRPPQSTPLATPSVPATLSTTRRTALEPRIHPRPRMPSRSTVRRRASPEPPPRLGQRRKEAGDKSNLTSGPAGPTVSDPTPPTRV